MGYTFDISHSEGDHGYCNIFWSGRSQAVRLPKEYRLEAEEVRIRRHGNSLVLEPVPGNWHWLDEISGQLDKDFVQAVNEPLGKQSRPDLDKLFR